MKSIENYRQSDPLRWTGRIDDAEDPLAARVHQAVEVIDLRNLPLAENGILNLALLGFCVDEGVNRNMGRVGASDGPWAIRKELAKLPANFIGRARLVDAGDVFCLKRDLETAQVDLSEAVERLIRQGYFPLVLGGGHEIVYGHYNGLRSAISDGKPPILVNLDAHLDLRNFDSGGTSGTSFYQIATEHRQAGNPFDYICIGAQTYGNTRRLYMRAEELGVDVYDAKDITEGSKEFILKQVLERLAHHEHIYLTLDMDVLNAAHAPGVSSPQPFGLDPALFLFLVKGILSTGKVRSLDIAEVSPRYDADYQTAKLAAVILYAIINTLCSKGDS